MVNSYLYTVFKCSADIFTCKIHVSLLCASSPAIIHSISHAGCMMALSIQYPNVEEIHINVLVLFILKKLPIAFWSVLSLNNILDILLNDRNCNIQSNNQQSNSFWWKLISTQTRTTNDQCGKHCYSYIGRDTLSSKIPKYWVATNCL